MVNESIESKVARAIAEQVAPLAPGFAAIDFKNAEVELADMFTAVETGLMRQRGPGIPLYQLSLAVHVGTRRTGDGMDTGGCALDSAYAAIRDNYSRKTRFVIAPGWFAVGVVPGEPETQQNESHTVRILQYTVFIINKEVDNG